MKAQIDRAPFALRVLLYGLSFAIPLEFFDIGPFAGNATPSAIVGYLFVLVSLLYPGFSFRNIPKAFWAFLIYICLYWLFGLNVLGYQMKGLVEVGGTLTQLIGLFLILSNLLQDSEVSDNVWLAFFLGCLVLAIIQILGVQPTDPSVSSHLQGRSSALGDNPNRTAQLYDFGLAAGVGLLLKGQKETLKKIILIGGLPLMLYTMVANGSRGGVVALVCGACVYVLAGRTSKQRRMIALGVVGGLICLVVLSVSNATIRNRWLQAETGNLAQRQEITPVAIQMFEEQPLTGWGPENHMWVLGERIHQGRRDTHNVFLYVADQLGIIGLMPVLYGTFACLLAAWRVRFGPNGYMALSLMVCLIVSNFSSTTYNRKSYWLISAYAIASGAAFMKSKQREEAERSRNLLMEQNALV